MQPQGTAIALPMALLAYRGYPHCGAYYFFVSCSPRRTVPLDRSDRSVRRS
jgi:hypothetical protein